MLKERARIVAVEQNYIWVETSNQSVCGSCSAEKGCGQGLLARWVTRNGYLRVLLNGRKPDSLEVNDSVSIGIPEDVVVKSAMVVYFLPLALLMLGAALAHSMFATEWVTITSALIGFAIGAAGVVLYSYSVRYNQRYQPVLLDLVSSAL